MSKKKISRKSKYPLNLYLTGGDVEAGIGAASGIINAAMSNAQIKDTSDIENSIQEANTYRSASSSNEDLMNEWGNMTMLDNVDWRDLKQDTGSQIGGVLSGTVSGASAGGIIGAGVGLLGGLAGVFAGNAKAKRKARNLNKKIDAANSFKLRTFNNKANAIDAQNDVNVMSSFYSKGGKIHIAPSKRGTFKAQASKMGMGVQEAARHILAHKDRYSPSMIKKANFARNASKWHDDGGFLNFGNTIIGKYLNEKADRINNINDYRSYVDWSSSGLTNFIKNKQNLIDADNYFANSGIRLPQRVAMLANAIRESGGDHEAKNAYYVGMWQHNAKNRYPGKTAKSQIEYTAKTAKDSKNWSHGGKGGPTIKTGKEAHNKFWKSATPEEATIYFTKGYEAPTKRMETELKVRGDYAKALKNAIKELPSPILKRPDIRDEVGPTEPVYINGKKLKLLDNPYSNISFAPLPNRKDTGGFLDNTHGGVFDNGVTIIGNGNTHENNPNYGVQIGVDNEGIPNLVEEGEVIYNDYVFSNRLFADKKLLTKYNLPSSYHNNSFAKIAENLNKESSERPNDPISKNGLMNSMNKLMLAQEDYKYNEDMNNRNKNMFPEGGDLNPYSNFTPLSDDSFYTPKYMDFWNYISNNRDSKEAISWLNRINSGEFGDIGGNTFNVNDILRLAHDYKRGPVHNAFKAASEAYRKGNSNSDIQGIPNIGPILNKTAFNLSLPFDSNTVLNDISNRIEADRLTPNVTERGNSRGNWPRLLKYAPVVGSSISVLTDALGLTNKPDYSNADLIGRAASSIPNVDYTPIGNYLAYRPLDRDYYINKLNAQAGATRRVIENQSGGNRGAAMAGILAADYNAQGRLGDLMRQAEEYNLNQRERVEGFNRQTNMFNSEMGLRADIANRQRDELRFKAALAQAQLRDNIDSRASAAKSANLTRLFENLGNVGTEEVNKDSRDALIGSGIFGTLNDIMSDLVERRRANRINGAKKNGGNLNKRKRNLTY